MSNKTKLVRQQLLLLLLNRHSSFYGAFLGRSSDRCVYGKGMGTHLLVEVGGWVVDVESEWLARTVARIRPRWQSAPLPYPTLA